MGVVYKLKQEVVDFIINEKKLNPSLGCRNLVGLIEVKFQAKISKSAINGVIKNAQLSSSIGRKPMVIRSHSKVSKNLSPAMAGPDEVITRPPTTNGSPRHEGTEITASAGSRPGGTFGGDSLGIQEPRIVEPSPLREEKVSLKSSQDKGVFCDGAGCFFLKAAQWELFRRPMLGKMISKYVSPELMNDADTLMDVLLFLPLFGIPRVEDISTYEGSGLWALQGLTESIKPDKFLSLMNGIQGKKDFFLRLSSEIPQIFSEAVYNKIILEDQTELVFDAQYRNLRSIKEWPVYYSLPIEKSLERLTGEMIANGRPAIIKNISAQISGTQDDYGFSPSVYQLIAAFENRPGKRMVKAAVLDERGEEISSFSVIPAKQRFFILGALCHSEDPAAFLRKQEAGDEESHREEILPPLLRKQRGQNDEKGSEFYEESFLIRKNSILTEDLRLRAIFVKKPDSKDQVLAILTNIPVSDQSSLEVISEYLEEWPNFSRIPGEDQEELDKNFYNDTKVSFNNLEIPDLWKNFEAILGGLNKYCQRHFFPKDYARMDFSVPNERFYQLEGHLKKSSSCLELDLILPESYAYRPDLEYAVRKLNEFSIHDYAGQTLFLKIVP